MLSNSEILFIQAHNNKTENCVSYIEKLNLADPQLKAYFIKNKAWLLLSPWKDGLRIDVYVLPEFRNQGYARKLIELVKTKHKNKLFFNCGTVARKNFYNHIFEKENIQTDSEIMSFVN